MPPVWVQAPCIFQVGLGKGVSRDEAYPAQLEPLLRLKGCDVRVVNSGVNGQTTGAMPQRLDKSAPAATSLVIFQPGGNGKRKGLGAERAKMFLKFASAFPFVAYT